MTVHPEQSSSIRGPELLSDSDREAAEWAIDAWRKIAEQKHDEVARAEEMRLAAYDRIAEMTAARDLCKRQTAEVSERWQATAYALRCVTSLCDDEELISLDFTLDEHGEHGAVEALRQARARNADDIANFDGEEA